MHAAECQQAASRAERDAGLPPGLLQAIGRVETGNQPWAVDEAGAGRFFPSRDDAVAWVRQRQVAGLRSIDVGCFQVSLMYHPAAFATLSDAFDPDLNAQAAAAYLLDLHARLPDWGDVAAAYHSQTPFLGVAYRARVLAWWQAPGSVPAGGASGATAAATIPAFGSLRFLQHVAAPSGHLPRILRGDADEDPGSPVRLIRLVRRGSV